MTNISKKLMLVFIFLLFIFGMIEFSFNSSLREENYNLRCQIHGGQRYENMNICVDEDNKIIKW